MKREVRQSLERLVGQGRKRLSRNSTGCPGIRPGAPASFFAGVLINLIQSRALGAGGVMEHSGESSLGAFPLVCSFARRRKFNSCPVHLGSSGQQITDLGAIRRSAIHPFAKLPQRKVGESYAPSPARVKGFRSIFIRQHPSDVNTVAHRSAPPCVAPPESRFLRREDCRRDMGSSLVTFLPLCHQI